MEAQASGMDNMGSGEHVWELLSPFVDGETSADETRFVEKHIANCSLCAGQLALLRATGRSLRKASDAFPSPALFERIACATYEKPTFAERVYGFLRPAPVRMGLGTALAAGLAAVAVLVPFRAGVTPQTDGAGGTMVAAVPHKMGAKPNTARPSVSFAANAALSSQSASLGLAFAQHMGTLPIKAIAAPPAAPIARPVPAATPKSMTAGVLPSLPRFGTRNTAAVTPTVAAVTSRPVATTPKSPAGDARLHPVRKPMVVAMLSPLPGGRGDLTSRSLEKSRLSHPDFKVDAAGPASVAVAPVPVRPDTKPGPALAELTSKASSGGGGAAREAALPSVSHQPSFRLAGTGPKDDNKRGIIQASFDRDAVTSLTGAVPLVTAPVN